MKETARSLRTYFVLVGVVNGILSALVLLNPLTDLLSKVMSLASLVVAAAAFAVAFALPTLLRTAPIVIGAMIALFPAVSVVSALLRLLTTGQLSWVNPAVSLAVAAYLYVNVRRLSREAVLTR
jgi:hypothetical protein